MKNNTYNPQEIHHELQSFTNIRQSLESTNDVSGSMIKLNNAMTKIKPLMNKQMNYIRNFVQTQHHSSENNKESELRRYINRICQIVSKEINQLIFIAPKYFTLDIKTNWNKIKNQFQKHLQNRRQNIDQNHLIQFLFTIMNMHERLFAKFLQSILYRKCLLFRDLNIIEIGHVHTIKKQITKTIETLILNNNYAPTCPLFQQIELTQQGNWTLNKNYENQISLAEILTVLNTELEEVFNVVRNYANLNQQQRNHSDIKRNDEVVISLRKVIQDAHINYQLLEKKYRQAVSKDERLDIIELKQRLTISEELLQSRQLELKQLKYQFRDSATQSKNLKDKIKELETDLYKITNSQMKKLKELETIQHNLTEQLNLIHKKISNFGNIFQFQSEGKKALAKQIINSKQAIEDMAGVLGKSKRQNKNLKLEIQRLNQIILQLGYRIRLIQSNQLETKQQNSIHSEDK